MYRYKNIIAELHLTDHDKSTIKYAALISKMAKSEKVRFVHVHVPGGLEVSEEVPEDILKEYPGLIGHTDEAAKKQMEEVVKKYFDGHPDTELVCEAIQGKPLFELLSRIRENDIDLVVVDRENPETSGITLSERLARKAPCSVLMIPEGNEAKFTRVLVALDFSKNSEDAMDVAIAFASAAKAELVCLNVYSVPAGYYKTGKSHEQFSEILKKNSEENFKKFISKLDLKGLSPKPLFVESKSSPKAIMEVVDKEKIDLLVLGAKGRSSSAAVLLGSVTEKLIWATKIPLLAVKKKGAGMGLLDVLLKEMGI